MNAFTFILRNNHEHPPKKLIVTKFIRHTLPMINNKAFLDFIDKISRRLDNKNKKHKYRVLHERRDIQGTDTNTGCFTKDAISLLPSRSTYNFENKLFLCIHFG